MQRIEVMINGEPALVPPASTIAEVLRGAEYDLQHGAVAVNESFLPRHDYATQLVQEGDRIEVLMPFAGG
jgi:sulfur carrier protein